MSIQLCYTSDAVSNCIHRDAERIQSKREVKDRRLGIETEWTLGMKQDTKQGQVAILKPNVGFLCKQQKRKKGEKSNEFFQFKIEIEIWCFE